MADSPLKNSTGVLKYTITSDGKALPETAQIVSVTVNHSTNRIPWALITVIDGDMPNAKFPLADGGLFKPGALVVISVGYDSSVTQVFSGVVLKHGVKIAGQDSALLQIECCDKAMAMTIGRKNANFVNMTDNAIIAKLIGNCSGLSNSVDSTSVTYKELVQHYVSDWDYLLARAEVNGFWVQVEDAKVSVKAPVTSGSAVHTLTYGIDLIEFQAELDARWQLSSVASTSWDMSQQKIVTQKAPPAALTGQGDIDSKTLAAVLGVASFGLQSDAQVDSATLTSWAKAQQLKSGLSRIRGRMRFQGSAKVKQGVLLQLAGVGTHFNGNVLATNVIHQLQDGNWTTEVEFGMPAYWFAEQHPLEAPQAAGVTAGMSGLHIGVVKKLDADPENQYKIQVSIPVMQAETDGVWARFASFYGSSGFGAFIIPEIGDEVVLGFFNDDPSCPVILGSLYSSKHAAAYQLTAENNLKALVTRSKMKLEFDDDKKIITLLTPASNTIVISDDGKSILLQDQTGNKVELSTSGILLDSPKDITINAKGKVAISAVNNVEITAKADVKTTGLNINNNANVGFVAKGAATAELSASGQTTVKGAMVMIN